MEKIGGKEKSLVFVSYTRIDMRGKAQLSVYLISSSFPTLFRSLDAKVADSIICRMYCISITKMQKKAINKEREGKAMWRKLERRIEVCILAACLLGMAFGNDLDTRYEEYLMCEKR